MAAHNRVYFSGFNGYKQWPDINKKVTNKFIEVKYFSGMFLTYLNDTHSTLIAKRLNTFEIHTENQIKNINCEKEWKLLLSNDDFIIFASGLQLKQFILSTHTWIDVQINKLKCADQAKMWDRNEIVHAVVVYKMGLVVLLSNGTVWKIDLENGDVEIIFPNHTDKVIRMSSGFAHVLLLTECGCLLAFGCGSHGELGCGDLNSSMMPVQVPTFDGIPVTKIFCGGWHSCALTDTNDLYMWGWNISSQLGISKNVIGLTALPEPIELDIEIVDVACGSRHSAVLTGDNTVLTTGWNAYGQLGLDKDVEMFTEVPFHSKYSEVQLQKLSCGPWSTYLFGKESSQ